ncbi:MAG: hydroxymethylbilane synthase [Bacteroidia bacterium]|nr:hydroxymethylbilane synthase [Bacteroidia bacterium]
MKIKIGTRGSDLALWQANYVKQQLELIGHEVEINIIKTQGDKIQNVSFDKLEGKGFFTKEIEDDLLNKEVDLAVHSYKDLPTQFPEGLIIAGISSREDPSECLLIRRKSHDGTKPLSVKSKGIIGTSSVRRKSQLMAIRNDIEIKPLRGNVPTRVQKLKDGEYDAIMLAYAGVLRLPLELGDLFLHRIDPDYFVPAPAQGALAYQIREDNKELQAEIQKINNPYSGETVGVEREILRLFEGGCQVPIGVYCSKNEDKLNVYVSKSKSGDELSLRYHGEFDSSQKDIAINVVNKVNGLNPTSVFISKDLDNDNLFLKTLTAYGYSVQGQSLIEIKPLETELPKDKFDWIFFSSKNGVNIFFDKFPKAANKIQIGVIGEGTKSVLNELNIIPDFVGHSSDTIEVGKSFSVLSNGDTVLFPKSRNGLDNVKDQLTPETKALDFPIYETTLRSDFEIPESEILVFTSPSNVEAYLTKYQIDDNKKVLAIGNTTEKALKENGIKNIITARLPNDLGLLEAVFSI